MKILCIVAGLALIAVAVMYFVMPAGQLPGVFPGFAAGDAHVHVKHGLVAGVIGLVLLGLGWRMR
jgi:hypothetical protein